MSTPFLPQPPFGKITHVHMVGIGGIGMSAIAEILLHLGLTVSGSDARLSDTTRRLTKKGATIFEGHGPKNIKGAGVVVHTSAVDADKNPETRAALEQGIPVIKRADILAELMRKKFSVGVAGTHGKTTTTTMVAQVVQAGGFEPTALVGGRVESFEQSNALPGDGDVIVVEADEFDRTFLKLPSSLAILTNIELEHVDIYEDLADLKDAFVQFTSAVPFYGATIACIDDENIRNILPRIKSRLITYGLSPDARLQAQNIEKEGFYSSFTVLFDDRELGRVRLKAPGDHNIQNALAAVAVGLELSMDFDKIRQGLEAYSGILRRFYCQADRGGLLIIDDYAHHPTEVKATIEATKLGWPHRRMIAVFQPHLYSRTQRFHREFGEALARADLVVITDVYASRESPIDGITGALVAEAARAQGHKNTRYIPDKDQIPAALQELASSGDIIVTMGAGDIDQVGRRFAETLQGST